LDRESPTKAIAFVADETALYGGFYFESDEAVPYAISVHKKLWQCVARSSSG